MRRLSFALPLLLVSVAAVAAPVTDPNDARTWQGAGVGTFATLFFGSNTATTRQQVIDAGLLDDGTFNPAGFTVGTLISPGGGAFGTSYGLATDANPYAYTYTGIGYAGGANAIDANWIQTNNTIGSFVWDLGFSAAQAAVFNTIDHGPLPQEAIESTVYLSNDLATWTQAETLKVFLQGFIGDTTTLWDGFTYTVRPIGGGTFRYATIIWGGPGALQADGDNEINGIMGLNADGGGDPLPEPASLVLLGLGALALGARRR